MLSISNPMKGAGRENYYLKLAEEDYYGAETAGYWLGRAAAQLKLAGNVERAILRNLLDGFSPDGKLSYVQNAGQADRQRGWDLTFSAPKSVSVIWAVAPAEMRVEIEEAHREAVARAVWHIEREAGITRRGHGGTIREHALLVFAAFPHFTSRALDPQIHTHALLLNLGLRSDGTSGSLRSLDFFRIKKEAGKAYRNELASQLQDRLNFEIEPEKVEFHIRGVPKELCRELSKRRQEIEKLLDQWGFPNPIDAKAAALFSRSQKQVINRNQLFSMWQKVGERWGWSTDQTRNFWKSSNTMFEVAKLDLPGTAGQLEAERKRSPEFGFQSAKSHVHRTGRDAAQTMKPKDAGHQSFIRIEWRWMFPRARLAKFYSNWKAPKIVIGHGRRLPRWDQILWKKDFGLEKISIQQRNLFRSAPKWSAAREFKLPVIRLGEERQPWTDEVFWKKELPLGDLRMQERIVVPKAPKWSPIHGLKLPALRFSSKGQNQSSKDSSQTHSQSH